MLRNIMLALLITAAAPTIVNASTSPILLKYKESVVPEVPIDFVRRKSVRDIIRGILKKRNRDIPLRQEYYLTPPNRVYLDKAKLALVH